jgi:hypothetical protein
MRAALPPVPRCQEDRDECYWPIRSSATGSNWPKAVTYQRALVSQKIILKFEIRTPSILKTRTTNLTAYAINGTPTRQLLDPD